MSEPKREASQAQEGQRVEQGSSDLFSELLKKSVRRTEVEEPEIVTEINPFAAALSFAEEKKEREKLIEERKKQAKKIAEMQRKAQEDMKMWQAFNGPNEYWSARQRRKQWERSIQSNYDEQRAQQWEEYAKAYSNQYEGRPATGRIKCGTCGVVGCTLGPQVPC